MLHFVRTKFIPPLQQFIEDSRSIGIILLACTGISLFLANFGYWDDIYPNFWSATFDGSTLHHAQWGLLQLPNSPVDLINDGFMAFFFFLAGMEIKRELLTGELASFKKAMLPVFAAIGGMIVPALLFALFAKGSGNMQGWAIPTATDIAFTLGVASLLGARVPAGLKIFITALAIIDDLGAIIVIAFFYGGSLHWLYLLACLVIIVVLWLLNKKQVSFGWMHWLMGLVLWYCMYNSGIHATVAGVLFAFIVPTAQLSKLEWHLHAPVYFVIMPLFALVNTAIGFPDDVLITIGSKLSIGIIVGLCLGKPLGICLPIIFLVKSKIAHLPTGVNKHKLIGAGILAGIGFTMSIFISSLAFKGSDQEDIAKIAVLLASFLSMIVGYCWLRFEKKTSDNKTI